MRKSNVYVVAKRTLTGLREVELLISMDLSDGMGDTGEFPPAYLSSTPRAHRAASK